MMFTINAENAITAHATPKQAQAVEGAEQFRNEAGFAKLAGKWPIARLVEIWNTLPGVSPVKKFKDRPTGVARIWKAIQELELAATTPEKEPATEPQEATQSPSVAPEQAPATKKATRARKAPEVARNATTPREGSKTTKILDLMKREGGVTLKEIMAATAWQAHSVRGFISGTLGKKMGLTVLSTKGESGERTYSIQA